MSGATAWSRWAEQAAADIRGDDRWRAPRDLDARGPVGRLAPDGLEVTSFASNDYLGLTHHPAAIAAAHDAIDRWGTGAGAARLIVGSRPYHSALEAALAEWKAQDAAVLFSTGFTANLGVMAAFGGPDVLVCSDALNHASIIDGRRLSGSQLAVYPHLDLGALDAILRDNPVARAVVVSETVFSMDGDVAPVDDLVALCQRHGALLVLDEAHAVLGPDPHFAATDLVLRVGTLSKTLGALGGFVSGPRALTDLIVNRARSYIFTTASSPADCAAALAALAVLQSSEGDALRARLRHHVETLRPGHRSPILPYVCGSETRALDAASALLARGLFVVAIRPPTVAPGTSRLRVTVSAAHTDEQVARLRDALDACGPWS